VLTRVALLLLVVACSSQEPSNGAASSPASAAAAAPQPSISAIASAPPFDLKGYCSSVCERSTRCGLEAAQALAVKGDRGDAAVVASAQKLAPETEASCLKQCNGSPLDAASQATLEAAQRCLSETACAPFQKCLVALAR
jgi:hypothetical protein